LSDTADASTAASELRTLLLEEETLQSALEKVVRMAVRGIPAADSCAVSVLEGKQLVSQASTDELADKLDAIQTEEDEGPCLDAIRTGETYNLTDVGGDERFPRYGPRAAETGLIASYSLPLRAKDTIIGALNLYGRTRVFDELDQQAGRDVAEQAAALLANVQLVHALQTSLSQLTEALESRDLIGQAKGIIMERQRCTSDDAFAILRKVSQSRNVKLREIAAQVVETGAWE
jgi:GAF domain-containing protein